MMLNKTLIGALGFALALPAAATPVHLGLGSLSVAQAGTNRVVDSYRIVPGDNVVITVLEKPELGRNLLIPPDGKVTYPLLGEIKLAGLTLEEIRLLLTTGLKKYLASPQVSVELAKQLKAEVSILGMVKAPGKQTLEEYWHLLDLISAAGGLNANRPELTRGTLVRNNGAQRITIDMDKLMAGDPEANIKLQPGDTFVIREQDARTFTMMVIGEVNRPGLVEVPKGGSYFEMFAGLGGFKPGAKMSKVRLTRKGQTIYLDLSKVMVDGSAKVIGEGKGVVDPAKVVAEPGDVLVVDRNEEFFTVWGGVGRAGRIEFPESGKVGVMDALNIAGGPIPGADLRNAAIMRPVKDKNEWETILINLEELRRSEQKPEKNTKKPTQPTTPQPMKDVAIQSGDILFIPIKEVKGGPSGFGLRDVLGMLPFIGFFAR